MNSQFSLLLTRRFWPLFTVQFLGAFNDNLAKSVFVVMIAYGLWDTGVFTPEILVSVAAGVFIVPFVLFTPFAGHLADRFDKARMIVWTKIAEVGIVLLAIAALYTGSVVLAFSALFLFGVQSAFFSPCKFSILPQHLKDGELVAGNGLVSSGTYIAILCGTMIGAFIAPLGLGKEIASVILIVSAAAGWALAGFILPAVAVEGDTPEHRVSYNIFSHMWKVWRIAFQQPRSVLLAIMGVAWFYFVAATFHAQFPNFVSRVLGADHVVLGVFMVVFSVGIAVGGLLNDVLLKGRVSLVYVPFAAMLVGAFGVDLYQESAAFSRLGDEGLYSLPGFIVMPQGWRVMLDVFALAVAAGVYVVPLRAVMQNQTQERVMGRVMSSSNMMDALLILFSAIFSGVVFAAGFAVHELYLVVCLLMFFVGAVSLMVSRLGSKSNSEKEERS